LWDIFLARKRIEKERILMALFEIDGGRFKSVVQTNFGSERDLQRLIESNLERVFSCRVVASEFSTGREHAGRIDTLGLSEENNPVIIEYKKVESSDLVNQSLFYLQWIYDHKGDFEIAAQKAIDNSVKVDWSEVRVICIAPNYKKYDLHAVQVMGANIELWKYRLFENSTLYLEEVFPRGYQGSIGETKNGKNPVMVIAGKKAAQTRATSSYTFDEHLEGKCEKIRELAIQIQEYILGLDAGIDENPKKFYVGYKTSQNIVCMEVRKQKVTLYLKLDPRDVEVPSIGRDVRHIGHYGTGDLEITVKNESDFEIAKDYIEMAYKRIGG
jgi:predicted transport protein